MKVVHFVSICCLSSVTSAHWNLVDSDRHWSLVRAVHRFKQGASNESDSLNIDADLNETDALDIDANLNETDVLNIDANLNETDELDIDTNLNETDVLNIDGNLNETDELDIDAEIPSRSTLDYLKENGHNSCPCAPAINHGRLLDPKVVGGSLVPDSISFPYNARFMASGYSCGATIINRRYVLTAMHCLTKRNGVDHSPKDALIYIGSNKKPSYIYGQLLKVAKFIKHPEFVKATLQNDIAIIEVDEDIEFDDNIRPACLPSSSEEEYVGKDAIVTGWGATIGYDEERPKDQNFPDSLKQAEVTVLDSSDPNCYRDSLGDGVTKMCAYKNGTDACQGDSGGPLTVVEEGVYVLIGVVSYGFGCAAENHPGVYARVNNNLQWIVENTVEGRC